jgi:hypothetical protein
MSDRRTKGWHLLWSLVIAHNVWAAGSGRELLSEAARRHRQRRPVVVAGLAGLLYAHLMGWLGKHDPLFLLGQQAERMRSGRI